MDAIKQALLFLALSVVLGLTLVIVLPKEVDRDDESQLLVGCGDDITGCLLEQVLERYRADGHTDVSSAADEGKSDMDSFTFIDCCSNASQWALYTSDIDMGFYCAHVSVTLVNMQEGFSIYGPIVMNGEVLGHWTEPEDMATVAVPSKRAHLEELARKEYPWVEDFKVVDAKSIAYSFGDHQIDGAVLDISRAFKMPDYKYTRVSDQDYVSFCLVVRDDVIGTPQFETFIRYYNETVEELNSAGVMQELYGMDDQFWEDVRLKFLYLPEPQQGAA